MKRFIIPILFIFILIDVSAQEDKDNNSNKLSETLNKTSDFMKPYGSYRINFGMNEKGELGMADNASRFGITGKLPFNKSLNAVAGIELGARLVDHDETIVFRGDPGYQVGEGNSNLFGRLGFVGIEHRYFSFHVGKQWSAYYDIAAYTDDLYAFGGEASGAFNNGTDGGISGTGRANQLFQLRTQYKGFKLALQLQSRHLTDRSVDVGDTYGGSIQYHIEEQFKIGFAMVIVSDGINQPLPNEPKLGDKSFVSSVAFTPGNFYFAILYSKFYQHESQKINDSTTIYFDGSGFEAFGSYTFGTREQWRAAIAMNLIWPDQQQLIRNYRMLYFVGEFAYTFGEFSNVFVSIKQNFTRNPNGNKIYGSILAMGLRFSFGY